jgi:LacI family transcriptional regulator
VIYAFCRSAEEHNVEVMLRLTDDPVRATAAVLDDTRDAHCAGTCLLSIPVNTGAALQMAGRGGGIVVADWDLEDPVVPCVVFDNIMAGRLCAKHLLQLGHRRILSVAAYRNSPSNQDRWEGFRQAIRAAGLPEQERILDMNRLQENILAHLRSEHPPTALVMPAPDAADDTIRLAESAGIAVPNDLSVITYGGYLNAARGRRITTVVMDYESMGRRSFEQLLETDTTQRPRREVIPCTLVQGMTTGPAPGR